MKIPGLFRPLPELDDDERRRGLANMTRQAVAASGADGLASGGLLAAFALLLGASNFQIGVMTAIPFVMQPLQLAAVIAVERLRLRKAVAVAACFFAYATWIPVALLPSLIDVPHPAAVTLLLLFIALRGVGNAFVNTSWNGWLRDFVPQELMGGFFARRLRVATIASAVSALAAALYIDWWKTSAPGSEVFAYSHAMLFGSVVLGFSAVAFMARMPEPLMAAPEGDRPSVFTQPGGAAAGPELPAADPLPLPVELRRPAGGALLHRLHADPARHEPDVGRGAGRAEPGRQRPLPAGLGALRRSVRQQGGPVPLLVPLLPRHPRLDLHDPAGESTPSPCPCSRSCTC